VAEPAGFILHVAVCPTCHRAFVATEKYKTFPEHPFPGWGTACTGSVVTEWRTFRVALRDSVVAGSVEEVQR